MAKEAKNIKDENFEFDPNDVQENDSTRFFEENELEEESEEPGEDDPENSEDDPDVDEKEEDEEEDFSDLGLDEKADKDKSKTKVPNKFKGKTIEEIAEAYVNLEAELGRMKNELGELKKNPQKSEDDKSKDKSKDTKDTEKKVLDLTQIVDVRKLSDAILTSADPGMAIVEAMANIINAFQDAQLEEVNKSIQTARAELQEKYFDEIDRSREARKAAEPFRAKAAELEKRYGARWKAAIPYMGQAIENNADLIKSPDDYEPLFERVEKWMEARGLLKELDDKNRRQKKTGGFSASQHNRKGGQDEGDSDDEQAILGSLYQD